MNRLERHYRSPYENWNNPMEVSDEELVKDFVETGNPMYVRDASGNSILGKVADKNPAWLSRYVASNTFNRAFLLELTKNLHAVDSLDITRVNDLAVERTVGGGIRPEDTMSILAIQELRYAEKGYPDEMKKQLRSELVTAINSVCSRFYLCREKGERSSELAAYVRFDDVVTKEHTQHTQHTQHMASFMTSSHFSGGALGQALLNFALEQEQQSGGAIYAECDPELVPFYERFGFSVMSQGVDEHGVPTAYIVREKEAVAERAAA